MKKEYDSATRLEATRSDGLPSGVGHRLFTEVQKPRIRRTMRPLLAIAALFSVVVQGYADPVQTVDLSGTWTFTPAGGSTTTIQVPGGGWKKQGFNCAEADYETTVSVPSIGSAQVTKIKFGAVNYQADLYVDGNLVGSSTQSYTPAEFDISAFVTPGSSHTIRVHVKGQGALLLNGKSLVPNGAGSWSTHLPDGIFRSAQLLVYNQVNIEDVFVRPYVSSSSLHYDVWLQNGSSSSQTVTLSGTLSSWNGSNFSYPTLPSQQYTLAPNSVTKVTVGPVNWTLGSSSYWWPNVPYQSGYTAQLHNLNLTLSGSATDQSTTRFGFRECTMGPDALGNTCYFLNGTRVNFRGDNLQTADYDQINNGGYGDAVDTLPGFLPPAQGNAGWPGAVDNYERLNYNFIRIHQIPCTPYMLDVCDEKGLMVMDETAIRGSSDEQDFVNGHDNMINHLKQLITRDRNHPAMVRISQSNEPDFSGTDSGTFEQDLYDAAMSVDGTRPISIDAANSMYDGVINTGGANNFNVLTHYGLDHVSYAKYTDEVFARSDRPYGEGEFIWYADDTHQGFTWFGTAVQAMRAKGASDARPYTTLSAWASIIPGVSTTDMQLEPPPWLSYAIYPLYGADNLSNPWSNYQIQRVQAGFNPVLVADAAYWENNKLSNANGDWPANVTRLAPGAQTTRTLNVYNDTFSGGTAVDVVWELHQDSATGTLLDSGVINATVPYGYVDNESLTFTSPNVPDGTMVYLVLSTQKGGVEMFRDQQERFVISSAVPYALANASFEQPAAGKISTGFDDHRNDVPNWSSFGTMSDSGIEAAGIAHTGSYSAYLMGGDGGAYQMTGYTIQSGDLLTIGFWAKVDYENVAGNANLTAVAFWNTANDLNYEIGSYTVQPLGTGWAYCEFTVSADNVPACIGGQLGIEFLNTGSDWASLDDVALFTANSGPQGPDTTPPAAPAGLVATAGNNSVALDWSDNSESDLASYTVYRSTTSGSGYTSIASGLTSSAYTDSSAVNGTTYYYVVTATDTSTNESAYSWEVSAKPVSLSLLSGTVIGSPGSWDGVSTIDKVFDGDLGTYYDAINASGDWAGLNLGSPQTIAQIKFCPRTGWASRMVGGQFQGSDTADFSSGVVTLYTVNAAPTEGVLTTQAITDTGTYRYVRYIGPANSYCNIAEAQFFTDGSGSGGSTATADYVSNIAMSSAQYGGNRYSGIAVITVKDDSGAVVPNATVSVTWSGAATGTASATTDSSGNVTFESSHVRNGGTFTVTVTGVTAAGLSYDSSLNVQTSNSITAP